MNKEDRVFEVDLLQLFRVLIDNLKYIILATVVFGILGYFGSKLLLTPIYEADAKMIVNTSKNDDNKVTSDQLNSAKNLVDTYAVIIRSRDVLNRVISELNLNESYMELYNNIKVKSVNNTQVMQIVVRHENVETATAIAAKILEISPSIILNTVEAGSVKPVEQAAYNPYPVSPNTFRNAIIVALIGFLISCCVFVVVFLMDNTYKTDLEIQNDLDLPVLGTIPSIESCASGREYGEQKKGEKR
ncbi:MAG: capsular biosynthesis protein [Oscillospiraceae bacterium]|nr:capsular biosynthesis protein [Oscillospiraceae bacterium]